MQPALIETLVIALAAYALGSVSFAVVVSKLMALPDPRSYGSKNPGATNVLRSGNKTAAIVTLLGDAGKGWLAVHLARGVGSDYGMQATLAGIAALAVFLGHLYPLFLGFKGGKGGATVLGVFLALSWPVAAVGAALWLPIVAIFRYSSLATLLATAIAAASAWWFAPRPVAMLATVLVLLVWAKHHENIRRLLAGTESRVGQKKSA